MKRLVLGLAAFVLASALLLAAARAQWVAIATMATAKSQEGIPTETIYRISPAVPEVFCNWMVLGVHPGDQISGTFVMVDVGQAAPPNSVIDTTTFVVPQTYSETRWGHFSLARPRGGWPFGLYLVEIKKNQSLVATAHFMISN
jgi:hypothetical protein